MLEFGGSVLGGPSATDNFKGTGIAMILRPHISVTYQITNPSLVEGKSMAVFMCAKTEFVHSYAFLHAIHLTHARWRQH